MLLCLKIEIQPTSKCVAFFQNLDSGQSLKQKILSVNFSHALFSLLSTLGSASLGLALHGTVYSSLVWHSLVQRFVLRI
jgi:hypothetical protein